jgi:hypothetical protein
LVPEHEKGKMMELRNLDKNIIYQLCDELMSRNMCIPLKADFIYQVFSDLPREQITSSIRSMVERGWLQEEKNGEHLYLTDRGRSALRSLIPSKLLAKCEKSTESRQSPDRGRGSAARAARIITGCNRKNVEVKGPARPGLFLSLFTSGIISRPFIEWPSCFSVI